MSIKFVTRVLSSELEVRRGAHASAASVRLVLAKLADHANAEGVCWPSMDTIAKSLGITRRAVQYRVNVLIEQGLIEPVGKRSGGRWPTRYQLTLDREPRTTVHGSTAHHSSQLNGDEPRTAVPPTVHSGSPQPRTTVHPNHQEPPRNVSGVVVGGVTAAKAAEPTTGGKTETPAETALAAIYAKFPTADFDGRKLLPAIDQALSEGTPAERIVAAATQDPPPRVRSWTALVSSRIKTAHWFRPGQPLTEETYHAALEQLLDLAEDKQGDDGYLEALDELDRTLTTKLRLPKAWSEDVTQDDPCRRFADMTASQQAKAMAVVADLTAKWERAHEGNAR